MNQVVCKKCGVNKELNELNWKPNRSTKSGWQLTQCRACFNEYYRQRSKDNPEQRREKERKYKENNPEKYEAKQRRHHQRQKEQGKNKCINRNPETMKRAEEKRKTNPQRKAYERARWKLRQANGYNDKERMKYHMNPIPKRLKANARRIKKVNAAGSHTLEQFMDKLKFHGFKCVYCECELTLNTVTEDHRIPLSRGGTDFISNIVPACASCNSSKGAKTEQEYRDWLKGVVACLV